MVTLTKPVGDWSQRAVNDPADVLTVQELLLAASLRLNRPEYNPGTPDGKIARYGTSSTLSAIDAFQSRFMGKPDGVISPGRRTIGELAAFDMVTFEGLTPAEIMGMLKAAADAFKKRWTGGSDSGCCYPIDRIPVSYVKGQKGGRRYFGAKRTSTRDDGTVLGYRKHAACDLIGKLGDNIYAVDDGEVVLGQKHFYRGTHQIAVQHTNFVVRYCEIQKAAPGIVVGAKVRKGQLIAWIGKMFHDSMLHFEMYDGTATGNFTNRSAALTKTWCATTPYQRRSDLIDPTAYLESWKTNLPVAP